MRDQSQKLKIRPLINPAAAITDNTPQVSNIIDTLGFDSVTLCVHVGAFTDADATTTVLVEEGDVATLTDAAAVADADLIGTEAGMAPTFANDNTVCKIGYIGDKRYIRVTITPAANASDLFVSGVAILGNSIAASQTDQKVT